jgi:hypothetical protein
MGAEPGSRQRKQMACMAPKLDRLTDEVATSQTVHAYNHSTGSEERQGLLQLILMLPTALHDTNTRT